MKEITVHFMAKVPGQNRDKTRLRAKMPDQLVDTLYRGLIAQMEHLCRETRAEGMTCIWWWDGQEPFGSPEAIPGIQTLKQPEGNLGQRLEYACRERHGHQVFLGMDCPLFTLRHLRAALERVEPLEAGNQAILWPAEDGGFVTMICPPLPPGCLKDVPWGSGNTLKATDAALEAVGWQVIKPSPALWDVDLPEDVLRLVKHMEREKEAPAFCSELSAALQCIKDHTP